MMRDQRRHRVGLHRVVQLDRRRQVLARSSATRARSARGRTRRTACCPTRAASRDSRHAADDQLVVRDARTACIGAWQCRRGWLMSSMLEDVRSNSPARLLAVDLAVRVARQRSRHARRCAPAPCRPAGAAGTAASSASASSAAVAAPASRPRRSPGRASDAATPNAAHSPTSCVAYSTSSTSVGLTR